MKVSDAHVYSLYMIDENALPDWFMGFLDLRQRGYKLMYINCLYG